MNKKYILLTVAAVALVLLVLSMPAAYLWGGTVSNILRWTGVVLAVVYLVLRQKI